MVFGHEEIAQAFQRISDRNMLGHAYLFFGDMGVGKETFARSLAYYLERGTYTSEPSAFDTLLDAAVIRPELGGSIGIDDIRGVPKKKSVRSESEDAMVPVHVREFLWQTPLVSKRRTVIIDGADALTNEAQSALLKVLEEPPAHGLLILVTHDASLLFPTILSRVQKIYFSRLSIGRVESILRDQFDIPEKNAHILAQSTFGCIGRALARHAGTEPPNSSEVCARIERQILELRNKNAVKYVKALAWLLERESLLKRYSLGELVQGKAVDYALTQLVYNKNI